MPRLFHRLLQFCLLPVLLPAILAAQESEQIGTVVVTATKHETSLSHVSTSATVITAEELQRRGHRTVDEALRAAVGFDIAQLGGPGGISYPQLRGLPGKFMVVMIDGVRMNDPADANGGVGTLFSHLTVEDIERIEIIRGPQSSLYGSNAAAGVINIITRRGQGDPALSFSYEGGSLNSHRLTGGQEFSAGGFAFRADQSLSYSEGNVALERFRGQTAGARAGYSLNGVLDWESTVRYTRAERNYADLRETYSGPLWTAEVPDPNQRLEVDYLTVGNSLQHRLSDIWSHELKVGIGWRDRHNLDTDDGLLGEVTSPWDGFTLDWASFYDRGQAVPVLDDGDSRAYGYTGTSYDFDYRHTLVLGGSSIGDILSTGFEYQLSDYGQWGKYGTLSRDLGTVSGYLHNQLLLLGEALSLNAGLRYDQHEQAQGAATGQLGAAWDIRPLGLIARANYGSAFRAPSAYELFNPDYGNTALDPETSLGYEFGLEKYTPGRTLRVAASLWHMELEDAIVWVLTDPNLFLGHYLNYDRAESDGIEALVELRPTADLILDLNYTYTDSRRFDVGQGLWSRQVQLPYNKWNLSLTWLHRGASFTLDSYLVDGNRLRWNGVDRMDSYFKLDFNTRVPVSRHALLTLRLENLTDEKYSEEVGYHEKGLAAYAGIVLKR